MKTGLRARRSRRATSRTSRTVAPGFTPVNEGQTVLTNGKNVGGRAGYARARSRRAAGPRRADAGRPGRPGAPPADRQRRDDAVLPPPPDRQRRHAGSARAHRRSGRAARSRRRRGDGVAGRRSTSSTPPARSCSTRAIAPTSSPPSRPPRPACHALDQDFQRTGGGSRTSPRCRWRTSTSPAPRAPPYTIAAGTPLRSPSPGRSGGGPRRRRPVTLLDPSAFTPPKTGMASQDIQLTQVGGASLGINDVSRAPRLPGRLHD